MSLSAGGAFPWHTSHHYLEPLNNASSIENLDTRNLNKLGHLSLPPENIWGDGHVASSNIVEHISADSQSYSKQIIEKGIGNFNWGDNKNSRSNSPDTRQDDGVVLLVGLFNLLAVVVYATQEFLTGGSKGKDKRVILWQVQKVLDELVLRVHSSDTAANLISRALKTSERSPISGREIDEGSILSIVQEAFQEKDPAKLRSWLDDAKNKLIIELSSTPDSDMGPRIDPLIYRPLQDLYLKITETTRRGRSFSTSLLQEARAVAKITSQMSIKDVQSVLKVVNQLGRMQRRYDVLPMLKSLLSVAFPFGDLEGELQSIQKSEITEVVRQRRSLVAPAPRTERKMGQRHNSRSPRLSSKPVIRLPQEKPKQNKTQTMPKAEALHGSHPGNFMKRQGIVEDLEYDDLPGNWADKWFSLLTQVSPIALDFTNLYSTSRKQPYCLRGLLCKSNKYWRKQGTLHSAVTPFLSIIASWALEESSPHSLGDSLIAVRAGWMEKDCHNIYPDCQEPKTSSPIADLKHPLKRPQKKQEHENLSSDFLSKSGEIFTQDEPSQKVDFVTTSSTPSPPFTDESPPGYHNSDQLFNEQQNNLKSHIYHAYLAAQDEATLPHHQFQNHLNPHSNRREHDFHFHPNANKEFEHQHNPHNPSNQPPNFISRDNVPPQQHPDSAPNSPSYPQSSHPQQRDSIRNKHNPPTYIINTESSLVLPTNSNSEGLYHHEDPRIDPRVNRPQNDVTTSSSETPDQTYKKKYYDRYDKPDTDVETENLVLSDSVSGMALQDRLVLDRRKMLLTDVNLQEMEESNKESMEESESTMKFENRPDDTRNYYRGDSTPEPKHKYLAPWAKEGAASVFLSQPSYSSYLASQKPAFTKPPKIYEEQYIPNMRPPISPPPHNDKPHHMPPISQSQKDKPKKRTPSSLPRSDRPIKSKSTGLPKYKYGVRRGLPAGNVDGNGLLEPTDNKLYSPSLKYKKNQSLPPQSLALTAPNPKSSRPNKQSKKQQLFRKTTASVPTSRPPSYAPTAPSRTVTTKATAQFGFDDAITDLHRNEILHQYVRDRQIRKAGL